MKRGIIIAGFIYIIGLIYLTLPSPVYPDLTDAKRSDEPGDTWQHPDQKGYYTNLTRAEVLEQIQSKFTIKIFGINLPSYRLNYRPEEAATLVRDQLNSYYLEEIIYPFRESIFVNGWEPTNSPKYANNPNAKTDLYFQGQPFLSKVTLKPTYSNPLLRILVWTLAFPASYLIYLSIKKSLKNDSN
ncbi:MAG TPA: hypothetical protein PLI45_01700 [Candidatus Woesebacteria bacterium]|nr:hypothetical protein [Candidatus Woesebacteria bacterium]